MDTSKIMTNLSIEDSKAMIRLHLAVLEVDVDAILKEFNKLANKEIDSRSLACALAIDVVKVLPFLSNESRNNLIQTWSQKLMDVIDERLLDVRNMIIDQYEEE